MKDKVKIQMDEITIKYWSPHGRQEETKFKKGHNKIDLVMRAAKSVDLSDVSRCTELQILDLSNNLLESIDLWPLADSASIHELRVNNNHLTDIDLWPLVDCVNLGQIDLSDNRLHGCDISPVFLRSIVRMDSSTVISADYLLRYIFTRSELQKRFQLIRPDGAPWTAPPVVMWSTYKDLSKKYGWPTIKHRVVSLLGSISKHQWFGAQHGLLIGFGMEELAGYDGNPRDLIKGLTECNSFDDARHIIFDNAIDLLGSQLQNGGPTLFLDIEKMRRTRASRLIPLIVKQRKQEIEQTNIWIKGSKVYLECLWMTHYGFQILSALKYGFSTDSEGLTTIKRSFEGLGMFLKPQTVSVIPTCNPPFISISLQNHVRNIIQGALE